METRKPEGYPKVAIIILNWNGWEDTIECLESLYQSNYLNYNVILVDNGSDDESIRRIKEYCEGKTKVESKFFKYDSTNKPIEIIELRRRDIETDNLITDKDFLNNVNSKTLTLILNEENLGFAKGNNVGIKYALKYNFDYIMLLNNDTVVSQKSFLNEMISFMEENKNIGVSVPCICYYDQPNNIWNCGGKLLPFGWRRYFTSQNLLNSERKYIDVSFITGCALLIRKSVLERFGLLTEDFFFGEEDYELSIRMKKNKVNMACVLDAKIYHKVSSSVKKLGDEKLNFTFIHHLNRLVHLKRYYSRFLWELFRIGALLYIFFMLRIRYRISYKDLFKYIKRLIEYSNVLSGVDKENFERILQSSFQ